jgi:hypothetical protein
MASGSIPTTCNAPCCTALHGTVCAALSCSQITFAIGFVGNWLCCAVLQPTFAMVSHLAL